MTDDGLSVPHYTPCQKLLLSFQKNSQNCAIIFFFFFTFFNLQTTVVTQKKQKTATRQLFWAFCLLFFFFCFCFLAFSNSQGESVHHSVFLFLLIVFWSLCQRAWQRRGIEQMFLPDWRTVCPPDQTETSQKPVSHM